jgi:hypothetical protein
MVGHAEGIIASSSGFEYTGYTTLGVGALVSDDPARWIGYGNQLIVAVVRVLTVEHICADDVPSMCEASSRVIRERRRDRPVAHRDAMIGPELVANTRDS